MSEKQARDLEIAKLVEEFIANGGVIQQLPYKGPGKF